jgi:hypothetical protein
MSPRPVSVGDWAKRISEDHVGRVAAIFETPWDTKNKGADHTRTVARLEYGDGLFAHVFLDQLVPSVNTPISLLDEATIRPMAASTLEKLIKHHRATCPGEDCDISLGLMIPTYERLIQRQITEAELKELFL